MLANPDYNKSSIENLKIVIMSKFMLALHVYVISSFH